MFAAQPKQTPEDTALVNDLVKQGITPLAMFKRNIPPIADLFSEWVTGSDGKKTRDYTNGAKRLLAIDLLVESEGRVWRAINEHSSHINALIGDLKGQITASSQGVFEFGQLVGALTAQNEALTAQAGALTKQNEALTAQAGALTAYVNDLAARLDAMDAKLEQRATMPTAATQSESQSEAPAPEAPTEPIKDLGGVPAKINAEMSKIEKAKAKAKDFATKNTQPVQAPVQAPAPVTPPPVAPTALAQSAVAEAIAMDFGGDLAEVGDLADADLEV